MLNQAANAKSPPGSLNIKLDVHLIVMLVVVLVGERLLAERFLEFFDGVTGFILRVPQGIPNGSQLRVTRLNARNPVRSLTLEG